MNIQQAKEIILKQVYDDLQINDYFLSGDTNTKDEAFESVIGASIYDFLLERADELYNEHSAKIDEEYNRLCKVGEENRIFYNKMIQYLDNL